ncbi:cytochrome c [Devosia lucknowensis]|nr:cytochrome c [Devosia lucknowensis]
MMGMMMLSEQMKVLAPLAGGASVQPEVIREAAAMIAMHGGPAMTDLFPEGSLEAPTEATPEIWARWQEFSGLADRLAVLGEELRTTADAPPAATAVSEPSPPPLSEWDRMSFASLMGIPTPSLQSVDLVETGSVSERPQVRTAAAVYDDISRTCASCHGAFRK